MFGRGSKDNTIEKVESPNLSETKATLSSDHKGSATPKRKDQEALRKKPLVPNDRKLAGKEERKRLGRERDIARVGFANGDEKYFPVRDRGQQKKFVRDFVDARFNVGEFLVPVMFAVIIMGMFKSTTVQVWSTLLMLGFFFFTIIDCVILVARVKSKLARSVGKQNVEKVALYAAMRSVQMRFMRMPKPQTKRGHFPEVPSH